MFNIIKWNLSYNKIELTVLKCSRLRELYRCRFTNVI